MLGTIKKLSYRRNTWQVFNDLLEVCAITLSNSVDRTNREEREKQYLETIGRYDKKETDLIAQWFAKLILELEHNSNMRELEDTLGGLFHALELHNKWKGQFFTPINICNAMGEITVNGCDNLIKENGYITVGEPACGSGAMVLGIANSLLKKGYNPQKHMVVTATDIDIKCVHMAYIQFALYGIPAIVVHGNTLTVEAWSTWYTPMYVWNRIRGHMREVAVWGQG